MNKEMQEDIKIAYRNFDSLKKEIINLSNKTIKEIDNLNIRIFERLFKKQLKEQKWKPEYGHAYYSFDAFYNVVKKDWMNDLFDQARMLSLIHI